MTNEMKASKKEYDRLSELYVKYFTRAADADIREDGEAEDVSGEYMELEQRYDFANEVVTSDDGLKGVALCFGEQVIPCRYDDIVCHTLSGVPRDRILAIATREGRDILVNSRGEEVLSAEEIRPGLGSIAPVVFRRDGLWGIANGKGEVVVPAVYDSVTPDENGYWWITRGGKHGFVDSAWNVVEPVFDSIESEPDEWVMVTLDGKRGYVDADGAFTEDEEKAYYNMFY